MTENVQAKIHLLVPDKGGPLKSGGLSGLSEPARYSIACTPKAKLPKHASGSLIAITCDKCRNSDYGKKLKNQARESDLLVASDDDFPEGVTAKDVEVKGKQ